MWEDILTGNTIADSVVDSGSEGGKLLAQCVPISTLGLVQCPHDGLNVILVAQGPCLLLYPAGTSSKQHHPSSYNKPFQIFPNESSITGFALFGSAAPSFRHHNCPITTRGFVWANNYVRLITIQHEPTIKPHPLIGPLTFIPIAAIWLEDGKSIAVLSLLNTLFVYHVYYNDPVGVTTTDEDDVVEGMIMNERARWQSNNPQNENDGGCESLYCATLCGNCLDNLLVFSGTTLKGILVWRLGPEGGKVNQMILIHKLLGHQGIPFSLDFNQISNMLISSSDDRTVIIWKFYASSSSQQSNSNTIIDGDEDNKIQKVGNENQQEIDLLPPSVNICKTLRGHEARVWKAGWVPYQETVYMVSVGEDSTVHVTNFDGSVTKSWRAHDGASIYTFVHDKLDDFLYTGAHDGAVYRWKGFYTQNKPIPIYYDTVTPHPWTQHLITINKYGRSIANDDYPRNVCVWGLDYFLALLNSGRLIAYSFYDKVQRDIFWSPALKRYGVLAVSKSNLFLAIGGLGGEFFLLTTQLKSGGSLHTSKFYAKKVVERHFHTKIINIHWLVDDILCFIVTLTTAYLYRFIVREASGDAGNVEIDVGCCSSYDLNHLGKPGLPSALLTIEWDWILGGDEVGSISLYKVPMVVDNTTGQKKQKEDQDNQTANLNISPTFKLKELHKEGVTCLVEYKSWLLSAGKRGGIKRLMIQLDDPLVPRLVVIQEFYPSQFEWVARLVPILKGQELLVGGFYKGSFVVYSWEQKRVLEEIPNLGGGHRRWDWRSDAKGIATLVFLRDGQLYFSPINLINSLDVVLKPGLHSKTVNCMILLFKKGTSHFFASGSEDASIRVVEYSTVHHIFKSIHRITSHASSVRSLVSTSIPAIDGSNNRRILLFSGGGRSEINATIMGLEECSECCLVGRLVVVGDNRKKREKEDIDTRVMDLSLLSQSHQSSIFFMLAAACSDGFIRLLQYSLDEKKFQVLGLLEGNNHAILRLHYWSPQSSCEGGMVLGGSSNGELLVWKIPEILTMKKIPPTFTHQVRKCAIMSLSVRIGTSDDLELVLGGDDCSVSFWRLTLLQSCNEREQDVKSKSVELIWSQDQGQRGAVTGVSWGKECIFSCSNDQVISRWTVMEGQCLGWAFGSVKDVQGFVVSPEEDLVTVYGHGISWVTPP